MPTLKKDPIESSPHVGLEGFRGGPWEIGGSFYVLTISLDGSSNRVAEMWKASSVTGTWTSQDTEVLSTSSGEPPVAAVADETDAKIYMVWANQVNGEVRVANFDTSTDSFETSELVEDLVGANPPTQYAVDVCVAESATRRLVVAYSGERGNFMGTRYDRVVVARRDLTGTTWTGPTAIDDGGAIEWIKPVCCAGSSRAHVIYATDDASTGADFFGNTYNPADDGVSTRQSRDAFSSGPIRSGNAYAYDGGTEWRIRFVYAEGGALPNITVAGSEEDGSGDIVSWRFDVRISNTSTTELFPGTANYRRASCGGLYCAVDDREYLLGANSDRAHWSVADAALDPTTDFNANDAEFDATAADNWLGSTLGVVARDGGTFVDAIKQSGLEYWELAECIAPEGGLFSLPLLGVGR